MHFDSLPEELGRKYEEILARDVGVPEHKRSYYRKWLSEFREFCKVRHLGEVGQDGLDVFIGDLRRAGRRGFQIEQARMAVQIYWKYFQSEDCAAGPEVEAEKAGIGIDSVGEIQVGWRSVFACLEKEIKIRHFSPKTHKSYRHWLRMFARFMHEVPAESLTSDNVRDFLSYLAVEKGVSASSQNQAFNALLFFFSNVLRRKLDGLENTPRARNRQMVPTVLTRGEVEGVLSGMEYPYKLLGQLLYGCGLRLSEGLGIRVQDLDLQAGSLRVHNGKGNKSRSLPLPKTLVPHLSAHFQSLRGIFDSDMKVGFAGVMLPEALERKLPGAPRNWSWQWVFPGGRLTVMEGDGKLRRFHLHESGIQKEIKRAAESAGLGKRVTAHTFRHSYATHLLQMGYDIRTVQDLLGHSELSTTMIYTHVLQSMSGKVVSPLDV